MTFHETVKEIRELLAALCLDIEKAVNGNKAASQRVRTGTIRLEKAAKKYRKESIKAEKASVGKKKPSKKAAPKKAAKPAKGKCCAGKCKTAKIPMKKR